MSGSTFAGNIYWRKQINGLLVYPFQIDFELGRKMYSMKKLVVWARFENRTNIGGDSFGYVDREMQYHLHPPGPLPQAKGSGKFEEASESPEQLDLFTSG